jgi:hypothetical protein
VIIRRRHTANFTIIGNALFDDERLSLDEIGLLAWLRSKPHDWEIRRPALMRRHKIGAIKLGREGLRRIIRNLMKTGWCRAEKTRLSDGTFSVVYEIRDEPGPEMSEEEVIQALSLVSSEADGDSEEAESDPQPPDDPPPAPPEVAGPVVAGRPWSIIKDLPNTDSQNTDSTKAPAVWSRLRAAWPSSDVLSPLACEKLFAALSPDERQRAFDGIGPYIANCRAKNRKLCDLSTYLKERRFNGNLAVPVKTFPIFRNTPQAFRWRDYMVAVGRRTSFMDECWQQGKPWHAESEWPPPLPAKQADPLPDSTRKTD